VNSFRFIASPQGFGVRSIHRQEAREMGKLLKGKKGQEGQEGAKSFHTFLPLLALLVLFCPQTASQIQPLDEQGLFLD
jgi:hypothetical protein